MLKQRTLQRIVKASGIGLHSGQKVMINFVPHTPIRGIVFRRIDLDPPVDIPADALLIQEAFMCSNLVQSNAKVGTIEHVMSAIAGLGIDNLIIEVSASSSHYGWQCRTFHLSAHAGRLARTRCTKEIY